MILRRLFYSDQLFILPKLHGTVVHIISMLFNFKTKPSFEIHV